MESFQIDLVICTYNNANLLDQTLASILAQQDTGGIDWAIWVIDNNCADHTAAVVEKHAARSPVPLRRLQEPVQGLAAARLCAVRNTRRDWMAFIDDDCLLRPDWLRQTALFAAEHPNCGAFGGKIVLAFDSPPPPYVLQFPFAYAGRNHGDQPKRRPWVAGLGMTLRRSVLEASGWPEKHYLIDRSGEALTSGGDVEMGLRMAARAEVWYNPACVLRHQIPSRRCNRPYLRRMLFGLGAARHNADALVWKRSYLLWALYCLLAGMVLIGYSLLQWAREIPKNRSGKAGLSVHLSPALGWYAAVWQMLWMPRKERRNMLGSALFSLS